MLMRIFVLLSCLLSSAAFGQSTIIVGQPFSGTAITQTGYSLPTSSLFLTPSSNLQFPLPMSMAFGIKTKALASTAGAQLFDSRAAGATGFYILNLPFSSSSLGNSAYALQFSTGNVSPLFNCAQASANCVRNTAINDGQWHNLCWTVSGTSSSLFVDGIGTDPNTQTLGSYVVPTKYWVMGNYARGNSTGPNPAVSIREGGLWNRTLSSAECANISNRAKAGFTLNSGSLLVGLVDYWSFANCNGVGCAAVVGSENWIVDTAPTVVLLTPSPGTVSGAVSMTASCTDVVGVASVYYTVDGLQVSTALTTAPYTFSWDSSKFIDGSHSIVANCTNVGSIVGTSAPVTVTTSNSVFAKNLFFDPVGGNDSNNCLSSATACKTVTKLITFAVHGGDTVAFKAGSTFTTPQSAGTMLIIAGTPASGTQAQWVYSGGASAPITFTTYGGSGNCNTIAQVYTDCVTFDASGTSTITQGIGIQNVSNITFQNIVIKGGSSLMGSANKSFGLYLRYNSPLLATGVVVNNIDVYDFAENINGGVSINGGGAATGTCVVKNSNIHGSTISAAVDGGILISGCDTTGNVVYWIGGLTTGSTGNGILYNNTNNAGQVPNTDKFNVTHDNGKNAGGCGSGVDNWVFQAQNITIKNNEAYNHMTTGGCDAGAFDFDQSTSNNLLEYNYSHNNAGYLVNYFGSGVNNNARYNISENDGVATSQQAVVVNINGTGHSSYVHNNTIFTTVGCMGGFPSSGTDLNFINNLCISNTTGVYGIKLSIAGARTSGTVDYNDYWSSGGNMNFSYSGCSSGTLTSFSAWKTGNTCSLDQHSISSNPNFSGTAGSGGTCWPGGSTPPAGPQNAPSAGCPSNYNLTTGSPAIGTGLDLTQAPFNLNVGSQDYYGNTIPNGVGTGYNMGADGAHH